MPSARWHRACSPTGICTASRPTAGCAPTAGSLKESALTEEKLAQIRALNEIAAARGQSLAEMALAWILKDGQVTSVLIGASRPEQILDNIKALDNTTFTAEELEAIDRASGYGKE